MQVWLSCSLEKRYIQQCKKFRTSIFGKSSDNIKSEYTKNLQKTKNKELQKANKNTQTKLMSSMQTL